MEGYICVSGAASHRTESHRFWASSCISFYGIIYRVAWLGTYPIQIQQILIKPSHLFKRVVIRYYGRQNFHLIK
jgi:hypothetical protein